MDKRRDLGAINSKNQVPSSQNGFLTSRLRPNGSVGPLGVVDLRDKQVPNINLQISKRHEVYNRYELKFGDWKLLGTWQLEVGAYYAALPR